MTEAPERMFDKMKPSDFVIALASDEGTEVGDVYRVISVWRDLNGGCGITVELPDGSGGGLNEGEYVRMYRADLARPVTVAEAAKVLLDAKSRIRTAHIKSWREGDGYIMRLNHEALIGLAQEA